MVLLISNYCCHSKGHSSWVNKNVHNYIRSKIKAFLDELLFGLWSTVSGNLEFSSKAWSINIWYSTDGRKAHITVIGHKPNTNNKVTLKSIALFVIFQRQSNLTSINSNIWHLINYRICVRVIIVRIEYYQQQVPCWLFIYKITWLLKAKQLQW